ncbi:hypothetical protein [Maridesulfovibrio ferrireducens]|uniref:hypothetical protein n=1 Tax=Maridesulfovibrio ferrireducens TaxID=246191 RepID=UPI001A1F3CCB|nr:hypothetical protein [Maridesulfovibrio ferrireducens]MBI9110042.1 hypothetical protein [Maridesulfovibrio ferrireducens]
MDSNTKWRAVEILANDSSRFSADLREMKKLHDQLQKFQGVWSNTQDTVSTMNSLNSYKNYIEKTEGRIVNIVIDGASVPYDIPDNKKA